MPAMASTNVISSVLGRAVDSVAGGADTGVPCLAVHDDVLNTLTPADVDYTQLQVDLHGALHVAHAGELGAAVTNDGTFAVQVDGAALTQLTWSPHPRCGTTLQAQQCWLNNACNPLAIP